METTARSCWCGAGRARVLFTAPSDGDAPWQFVKCGGCGVIALHPQPDAAALARAYSQSYYGSTRRKFIGPVAGLVGRFQEGRARLMTGLLPAGGRVLDIGCGNGGFLQQMAARGFRAEGTEWTAESAARVPASPVYTVHVGDLLQLDLPAGAYDGVTLWHVFEHLREPAATIDRIHALLRPGGRLVLTLPNHESWQARVFGPHWFHLDPPRHLFGFGRGQLSAMLEGRGFRIRRSSTWSLEQNPYGILQSILNAFGLPRDRAYSVLKRTSTSPAAVRVLDLATVALLAPPSIMLSLVESMAGRGGTMMLIADKAG